MYKPTQIKLAFVDEWICVWLSDCMHRYIYNMWVCVCVCAPMQAKGSRSRGHHGLEAPTCRGNS